MFNPGEKYSTKGSKKNKKINHFSYQCYKDRNQIIVVYKNCIFNKIIFKLLEINLQKTTFFISSHLKTELPDLSLTLWLGFPVLLFHLCLRYLKLEWLTIWEQLFARCHAQGNFDKTQGYCVEWTFDLYRRNCPSWILISSARAVTHQNIYGHEKNFTKGHGCLILIFATYKLYKASS